MRRAFVSARTVAASSVVAGLARPSVVRSSASRAVARLAPAVTPARRFASAAKPAAGGRVAGRVAIITGGTDGIGLGIAQVFASEGASLVLCGRDQKRGDAAVAKLKKDTGKQNITFVQADVSKLADMQKVAAQAVAKYGKIDILLANAGVMPEKRIDDMTEADWDFCVDINLKGVFTAVKAVLPEFKKNKFGKIVCTSSITGPNTAIPGWSHHCASKAGVNGFVRGLAIDLAKYNVTVNAVEPGNILTPGLAAQGEAYLTDMKKCVPLNKLGEPTDIGYAHLFLACEESKFVTGTSIVVDGGQTIPEGNVVN